MRYRVLKLIVFATLPAFLAGCLHLQLFGSIADAEVSITSIHDSEAAVLHTATSTGRDFWVELSGQEVWDSWGLFFQHFFVGIALTDQMDDLQDNAYYLVTARGGTDHDASNSDGFYDEVGAAMNGNLHAVLSGAQIKGKTGKVSALTEVMYQAMFIETGTTLHHDNNWYLVELDKFSNRLVGDLNEDGVIDYEDVLEWSVLFNPAEFRGSEDLLYEFRDMVMTGTVGDAADYEVGLIDNTRFDLAVAILDSGIDTEHPLAGNWSLEVEAGELVCDEGGTITTDPLDAFSEEVIVSISDGFIRFPQNDWSGIPGWTIDSDTGIEGSFDDGDDSFVATQILVGSFDANPDIINNQPIQVRYQGQFNGNQWSGSYSYDFDITGFDFSCDSSQVFAGNKLD